MIFPFNLDKDLIINTSIAGIVVIFAVWLIGVLVKYIKILFSKIILRLSPFLPKIINKILRFLENFLSILLNPLLKLIYLGIISIIILLLVRYPYGITIAITVNLIGWSFYSELKKIKSSREPIFFDTFEMLKSWNILNGQPVIDNNLGNPTPSLLLQMVAGSPNHSIIELKNLSFANGIIELDVYLEPDSLLNVAFRADFKKKKYYMARFDSRLANFDAFLRNDGNGWAPIANSNHTTTPNQWHKMTIVISGENFKLFNDNQLIISVNDGTYSKGKIGIFNEVTNARIDNFSIKN